MRQGFTVVAVPARDEAERIVACLLALARQTRRPDSVLVLANDCTDGTAAIASRMASALPYRLHVESICFPAHQAHAGGARRLAMAFSEPLVRQEGVLLTTDADAEAAPDWIERNCEAIADGADLVCGRVVLDPLEATLIPAHLHADDALECRLIELLDRIANRLDPDLADPLPRHTEAAGASLAVTRSAFHRVGGIPAVALGEDRAFVRALANVDARIRHDPSVLVSVSGRTVGRAQGGMADTIRRRIQQQDEFTDDQAEPAVDAYRRHDFRHRARQAWLSRSLPPDLAVDLGISPRVAAAMLSERYFGMAWTRIEAASPLLVRRRVRFSELQSQIDHALHLLEQDSENNLVLGSGAAR
jgi:GT2 family glycosyltransferase